MKVALVHDYLREYGGAERVVEQLHQMFPDAPLYVGFVDWEAMGEHAARFRDWDIKTTWLQNIPGIKKIFSPLRIFAPRAFASLNLRKYDLVISSSNAYFAKAVKVPNGKHLCYCHTPPRNLYGYQTQSSMKPQNRWIKMASDFLNHFLRMQDFEMAQKVDLFIANSQEVKDRIQKFYRREAEIIYPPVALVDRADKNWTELKKSKKAAATLPKKDQYLFYVNRLNFAKHPELAVKVAATNPSWRLKIAGDGPMKDQLLARAKNHSNIEFLGAVEDDQLFDLYLNAQALIYPVVDEDFGMVPIEAMALGTPVVAHFSGGPKETIQAGQTGEFFSEISVKALTQATKKTLQTSWSADKIHSAALKYSAAQFRRRLKQIIKKVTAPAVPTAPTASANSAPSK